MALFLGHPWDHDSTLDDPNTPTARADLQQRLIDVVRDFATGDTEDAVDLPFRLEASEAMGRPYASHLLRQKLAQRPE